MNNTKGECRLSHKLLVSAIAAFLVSATLFLISQNISRKIIHVYCEQPKVISQHIQEKAESLQQYVKNSNLSLSEISMLDRWMEKEDLTEVAVYRNNILLYSSHAVFPGFFLESRTQDINFSWQNGHTLSFADGESVAFINDLFEHRYTDYAACLNLLLFFLCFITIMILFIRKKVSYINTLEQEIKVLEGGDLNYTITVKGNDELTSLAQEIDEMRKAFIAREQYADKVRTASNQLMTGISHDLRTPLTALIGYLEVMEGEAVPAGQSPFLQKCKNRAFQIKSLTNNLFEYFFISTSIHEQLQFRNCTVNEILDEVINEHVFLMEQSGFTVKSSINLPAVRLKIDRGMIQRVFDNLFSNICRYADPGCPIQLNIVTEPQKLTLMIRNHVLNSPEIMQSTGLGLKVCEKIMLLHSGNFIHKQQGDTYTVQLHFPLI